ncbi:S1C family serine protease [Candidatus Pelagibacter ubique]|nr:S1C family serine protease [Candidatus Pelagibacter ubique]
MGLFDSIKEEKITANCSNPNCLSYNYLLQISKKDLNSKICDCGSKYKKTTESIKVRCSNLYCSSNHLIVSIQKADLNSEKCNHCNSKYMKTSKSNLKLDDEPYTIYKELKKSKIHNHEENQEDIIASTGSGFFVSDKGHIVTNFHVINNSNSIKFIYNDDEIDAKLIASDQLLDLALLKGNIKNKNYIKFSNKSLQKAQSILVAGFPFGKAISDDLKITGGIINSLKGIGNDSTRFQLDATINTGNSGGPIVDKVNGSLVGVAVEKLNKDGVKAAFGTDSENTNYGIKASQVRDFLESNNIKVGVKKDKFKVSELEEATIFVISKRNKK